MLYTSMKPAGQVDHRDKAQDVRKDEGLTLQGVYFTRWFQVLQFEEGSGERVHK